MKLHFTKMQGAGNDFVVLDETQGRYGLTAAQYRFLADRHFGVGADQILTVRPAPSADVDFEYVIHNADGGEVEHCGNGARCFARFVRERGLIHQDRVRVKVKNGTIELQLTADGRVTVDMGPPVFDLPRIPFDPLGQQPQADGLWEKWHLSLDYQAQGAINFNNAQPEPLWASVLSMGNPHAVLVVDDVDAAPVLSVGPLLESHPAFPNRVNVGFMQVLDSQHIRLRVFERGVGETLACGTGACAAVVAGIRLGLLHGAVEVATRGGGLTIVWDGHGPHGLNASVAMTGPATTVFEGVIDIPN
jgi:diaminopimelate epimerase